MESANSPEAYREQVELAAKAGLRIGTLVTRCLPEVLDAWEEVAARWPIAPLRWVLVHLNTASAKDLVRMRALGAVATTNPISYLWRSGAAEARTLGAAVLRETARGILRADRHALARAAAILAGLGSASLGFLRGRAMLRGEGAGGGAALGPGLSGAAGS